MIDFTGFSDNEIRAYFKSLPKNVCGRLREDQIRVYGDPKPKKGLSRWLAWPIAGSVAFFSNYSVPSQEVDREEQQSKKGPELEKIALQYPRVISGRIMDEAGNDMYDTKISVVDTNNFSKSNKEGFYKIVVPSEESFLLFESKNTIDHSEIVLFGSKIDVILKQFHINFEGWLGGITSCSVIGTRIRTDHDRWLINRLFH